MIHFEWPMLFALLPLPLLIYWLPSKNKSEAVPLKVPVLLEGIDTTIAATSNKKTSLILLSLVWGLLVLASTRPQWLGEAVNIPSEGREMMIAVDLSGSMQVEDMSLNGRVVNRLEMLKVLLGDFIERRTGDRLGLILFADDAYMQTPMTFDRKTVKQMLDETVLGLVGQQTAIGDAIALSVKRFNEAEDSNRVLLLLTDGQNTAGKITPEEALELAVANDITIYSIGIGADVMLQQSLFGTRKVNPSNDLDEKSLKNIADKTNGQYFRARSSEDLAKIYELLDTFEPVEQDQKQMRPLSALYYWPLGAALTLCFIYLIITNITARSSRRSA
ncbi:VWA domain-containing protein [Pseudocolwellia sp. AS88]|uniref:vWA domain-containing protein n=1 Tax=Pseudocolwellia sp. AS88 TaxID=3063958 RepID=UPI0026ECB4BA|nr:VWA domain-containing protein [Pseudocolwellia sp. AS88]MDO7085693.1 VWA domain-containing protein [Pseudocolwellia sp. AS88]